MTPLRIFLTGGYGKTSRRIASLIYAEGGARLVLSSRAGHVEAPFEHECVRFDWHDEKTYSAPFEGGNVDRVYLVAPTAAPVS